MTGSDEARRRHERLIELCERASGVAAGAERSRLLCEWAGGDESLAAEAERLLACEVGGASVELEVVQSGWTGRLRQALAAPSEPPVPDRIGEHTVLGVLGVGGASVVYEAQQRQPGRRVAIKALWAPFHSGRWAERFEREARALASLRHPGVPQVYSAGVEDLPWGRAPCIVMEVVEGCAITRFAAEGQLSAARRLELLVQACRAVEHAHQRGVIHRDLKPGNILVEGDAESPRVRVLDFGLAKLLDEAMGAESLTQHGRVMGSLPYMSPEQVDPDLGEVDTRTDVYGLGAVGYALLAGRPPHDVASASALRRIASAPVEPLSRRAGLPADLSLIFETALAPRREDRYASVAELRADLERWLRCEPISVAPPTTWYRAMKFVRRRPGAAAAAALGIIALAALGASLWRTQQATRESARIANQRYAESVENAGFLVGEVLEQLRTLPGSATVRRSTLERLRTQTEMLIQERPGDAAALSHHATVLHMLSDLELTEGRVEASLDLRRRARDIRAVLAERFPDEHAHQAALSVALVLVGDALKALGRVDETIQMYDQALAIDEAIARRHPDDRRLLDNLYWSHQRLWGLCLREGRWEDAQRHLERAEPVIERLLALTPTHPQTLLAAVSYGRERAEHARLWLRMDEAEAHIDRAVAAGERLLELAGRNRDYAVAVAASHVQRAGLLHARERASEGQLNLDHAETIVRRLLAIDGRDAEAADLLGAIRLARGRAALAMGHADEALSIAREMMERIEARRSDPAAQRRGWLTLPHALDLLVRSAEAIGQREQAHAARQRLIGLYEPEALAAGPDQWQAKLNLALTLLGSGEPADAARALALLQEAERDTPGPLFAILAAQTDALSRLADPAAAAAWRRAEQAAITERVPPDLVALHGPPTTPERLTERAPSTP